MPGERTTIRELARLSGVSVGTVSRALNGYTDVRPETRERIVRLARELDYTPAAAARTLVTQRSHVIGVFLETGEGHPDLQHPFFHEVLVGLKDCIGVGGLRPPAVRVRAARQRLRRPQLPQALPPPQRRRRRPDGRRRRRRGAAAAAALRAAVRRRRRRARRHVHRLRHVRQRRRRGRRGAPSPCAGPSADRHDHRAARHQAGHRPPARVPRGVPGARSRLPRRVRRVRGLLLRRGLRGRAQAAGARRAADGASSPPRT